MSLSVEKVGFHNLSEYVQYCRQYGPEHDASYLPENGALPAADHPAYLVREDGLPVGAVGLIRTPSHVAAGRGRFSVFHCLKAETGGYQLLYQAIRRHFGGLSSVYLFAPQENMASARAWHELGFTLERQAFVLVLPEPRRRFIELGRGYAIRALLSENGEAIDQLAKVINGAFDGEPGHVRLTAADVRRWFDSRLYLAGGLCLLSYQGQAIGSVWVSRDSDEAEADAAEITALGVLTPFRGRGLGRLLLNYAINVAVDHRCRPIYLSVAGQNGTAIRLYRSEGFELVETVNCYSRIVAGD